MEAEKSVVVAERLVNVDPWELYRLSDDETEAVVCKIALYADETNRVVEYGVWRADDADPSATGSLQWALSAWNDEAREDALERIARLYEEGLPETRNGVVYRIRVEDEEAIDEEGEDDEDEDDDEEDSDADDEDADEDDDEDGE